MCVVLNWNMPALAREHIRIVGSSTVYPFAASVAEHMGKAGDFRTPVVEATGTGGGFKLFCEGTGDSMPDIADASRPILPSEKEACDRAGVHEMLEIEFGYDGITLANSVQGPLFRLSKKQLFLALARSVPKNGKLVSNFYRRWSEIDPALPNLPIKVYGTPPVSGTRDAFVELVMQRGCEQIEAYGFAFTDAETRKRQCGAIREDGAFIEAGENGNLIVQKLMGDAKALGLLGFSFLDQNYGKIQGSIIDGTAPAFETIQSGSYGIARPLYFYVRTERLAQVPGLKAYVKEFLSEGTIGDEGYLTYEGLVPLRPAQRERIRTKTLQALPD